MSGVETSSCGKAGGKEHFFTAFHFKLNPGVILPESMASLAVRLDSHSLIVYIYCVIIPEIAA